MLYNAICCPDGTILHSEHEHDYKSHIDAITGEVYMNDGGNGYYYRRSVNVIPAKDISITTDDDFSLQREYFSWTSYGINGNESAKKILLKDLTEEHISSILRTQRHINGTYVHTLMIKELEYRKENVTYKN